MGSWRQNYTISNINTSVDHREVLFSNDDEKIKTSIYSEYIYHNGELYSTYSEQGTLYIVKLHENKEEILFEFEGVLATSLSVTDNKIYMVSGNSELFICDMTDSSVESFDLKVHNIDESNIHIYVDDLSNIFLLEQNKKENIIKVFKFDSKKNPVFSEVYDDMHGEAMNIFREKGTGNIVISSCEYGSEDCMIFINVINPEDGDTLERYESDEFSCIYAGNEEYECIAQSDNRLYGYNYSSGESTYLCDVNDESAFNRVVSASDDGVIVIEEQKSQTDSVVSESIFVINKNGEIIDSIPFIKNRNGAVSRSYISRNKDIYYIEEDYNAAFIEYGRSLGTHIVHIIKNNGEHSYFEISTDDIETYPRFMTADTMGNTYIGEEKENGLNITTYDIDGNILSTKILQNYMALDSYAMYDDRLYVSCSEIGEVKKCYSFDGKNDRLTEEEKFNNMSIFDGDSVYDIYIKKLTEVCGYSFETGETTSVFNYVNSGLSDFYVEKIYSIDDEEFVIFGSESGTYEESRCFFLKKTKELSSEVQVITVGGVALRYSDIIKEIDKFNRENSEYRIICKDYSHNDLENMNIDLLEKKIDVIISDSYFPISDYDKEMFVDLIPYIEKDESIELSDYYENIISLGMENGKMYEVIPQFSVSFILSLQKYFNSSDTTWTTEEFSEFIMDKKSFGEMLDSDIIEMFISPFIINYVDTESKKCDFDNEKFKNMVKAIETNLTHSEFSFPLTVDLIEGTKTLEFCGVHGYSGILAEFADEGLIFKGYPTDRGSGYIVCPFFTLSILKNCENKDGAWEFIKYFLTEEYQNNISGSVPLMKSCVDNIFKAYSFAGENAYADIDKKMKSQILEVINNADVRNYFGSSRIYKIVEEEIYSYINGNVDIDSMAKSVQSRVSLYLSERS